MTTLSKAPNGDWFARKAIPPDVRDAYQIAYGVRQEARFRRSKMSEAKARVAFAEWLAEVEGRIDALRSAQAGQPQQLTQRQAHVLVGRWYDWFIAQHSQQQHPVEVWDSHLDEYQAVLEAFGVDEHDDREPPAWYRSRVLAKVAELSRLPSFLAQEAVVLDGVSHAVLLDVLQPNLVAAIGVLRRQAGGDYSPDRHRGKLPTTAVVVPAGVRLAGLNAWEAFEAWVKERKPAHSTVNRWRVVFMDLNEFLEQRDIALITQEDAIRWKDKLAGSSAKGRTVNEVWLTAARTVFNWELLQNKVAINPFSRVKIAVARSGPTKGKFQEEDAETILRATTEPLGPKAKDYFRSAVRWVPWLCAYTGARSGEMTQLRKQDVEKHRDGFWIVHVTPDAGTVKGSMPRTVVLHDHLIEQGFIDFVMSSRPGPLFYDLSAVKARKEIDPTNPPRPPYVLVRQKLADWVRKLGVTDPGVGPNHGWRHTFRRRAARAKIEERIRDAFCGHSDPKVGRAYEPPDLDELADALKDFPRYPIETPKHP